jgi:DNA-binding NarL/FixJ family response regulator
MSYVASSSSGSVRVRLARPVPGHGDQQLTVLVDDPQVSTSVASGRLAATGEAVRKRTVETSTELTVQEAQIARLARDGLSNLEIGAGLFLSARTVEYHLSKVFARLGISARGQLHRVLPGDRAAVRPR